MNKTQLSICILSIFFLLSCKQKEEKSAVQYIKELVEIKKINLPADERTYYLSKSVFQFEENGKEYLHFGNLEKQQYEILIYDLDSSKLSRRIPLEKKGPNGVPAILGIKPFEDSRQFMAFQHNVTRLSIIGNNGKVLRRYSVQLPGGRFSHCYGGCSYFYIPSFCVDSVVYLTHWLEKPQMKTSEWKDLAMFTYLDLKSGQIGLTSLRYPSIFDRDVKNPAGGYKFTLDYNYKENRLVCSLTGYDSLMVSDDLKQVRWYNVKSRYLKSMRPRLEEANDDIQSLIKQTEMPQYHNIMYDKYRDVYYRFVELPYEFGRNESPYGYQYAREFSVIIFDKDFNIIGETKFPGNKYFYKMSFVGRDGLYISENNTANPEFDEDKLVFACFKVE